MACMSPRYGRLMYPENPFCFSDKGVKYEVIWIRLSRKSYGVEKIIANGVEVPSGSKEWADGFNGWALLNSGY